MRILDRLSLLLLCSGAAAWLAASVGWFGSTARGEGPVAFWLALAACAVWQVVRLPAAVARQRSPQLPRDRP